MRERWRAKEANALVVNRMSRRGKYKKIFIIYEKNNRARRSLGRGHLLIRRIKYYILLYCYAYYMLRGSLSNDERLFLAERSVKESSLSASHPFPIARNNNNNTK